MPSRAIRRVLARIKQATWLSCAPQHPQGLQIRALLTSHITPFRRSRVDGPGTTALGRCCRKSATSSTASAQLCPHRHPPGTAAIAEIRCCLLSAIATILSGSRRSWIANVVTRKAQRSRWSRASGDQQAHVQDATSPDTSRATLILGVCTVSPQRKLYRRLSDCGCVMKRPSPPNLGWHRRSILWLNLQSRAL